MTTETIEIPFDMDRFNELSGNERLRHIEKVISDHEHSLQPIYDWYIDESEIFLEYGESSLIVSIDEINLKNNQYSGQVGLMFDLLFFASCDQMSHDNEYEYLADIKIDDDYLLLTFTPPENKGLSNSTHSL